VTGGTNAGIMKCVGDAVRKHTVACGSKKPITTIGIAVWGCISNRESLDTNNNYKVGTLSCRNLKLLGLSHRRIADEYCGGAAVTNFRRNIFV